MFCLTLITIASLGFVNGIARNSYGGVMFSEANIMDHLYQAAVLRRHWDTSQFHFACSGAIVSQTFILTMASCAGDTYENFRVRVGSSYHQSGGDLHRLQDVFRHPNFTADYDSDIALLKLENKLKFSYRVALVKLPKQDVMLEGKSDSWTISTWDIDSKAVLQVFPSARIVPDCNSRYSKYSEELVTDNMICILSSLNHLNYFTPCCERDQGALLVEAGTLYGLSSWSYKCGYESSTYPSVFTRVSAFTTWIEFMLDL